LHRSEVGARCARFEQEQIAHVVCVGQSLDGSPLRFRRPSDQAVGGKLFQSIQACEELLGQKAWRK